MKVVALNTIADDRLYLQAIFEPYEYSEKRYYVEYAIRPANEGCPASDQSGDGRVEFIPGYKHVVEISTFYNVPGENVLCIKNTNWFFGAIWYKIADLFIVHETNYVAIHLNSGRGFGWAIVTINGKLYTWYDPKYPIVVIPSAATSGVVELYDANTNKVYISDDIKTNRIVDANLDLPVVFTFDVIASGNVADQVAMYLTSIMGIASSASIEVVSPNTVRVRIVKSGPGVAPVIVGFVAALVVFGVFAVGYLINAIANLQIVQAKRELVDKYNSLVTAYVDETNKCGGDPNCVQMVHQKYLPVVQTTTSAIGALSTQPENKWTYLAFGALAGIIIALLLR